MSRPWYINWGQPWREPQLPTYDNRDRRMLPKGMKWEYVGGKYTETARNFHLTVTLHEDGTAIFSLRLVLDNRPRLPQVQRLHWPHKGTRGLLKRAKRWADEIIYKSGYISDLEILAAQGLDD